MREWDKMTIFYLCGKAVSLVGTNWEEQSWELEVTATRWWDVAVLLVEGFESTEFLLFVKWLLSADSVDDEPPGVPFRDTSECDLPELPEPDPVLLLLLLFRFPPPEDVLVLDLEPIGLEFTLFSDMLLRKSFCRPLFLLLNQEQEGKRYINRVKKIDNNDQSRRTYLLLVLLAYLLFWAFEKDCWTKLFIGKTPLTS